MHSEEKYRLPEVVRVEARCDVDRYLVGIVRGATGNTTDYIYQVFDLQYRLVKEYNIVHHRDFFAGYGGFMLGDMSFSNFEYLNIPNQPLDLIYEFFVYPDLGPTIDSFYESVKNSYNENDAEYLSLASDRLVIDELLWITSIDRSNVSKYNDIGYYFERSGLFNEAVYLLEKVIEKFPNRTVAYINLGDAYWGLGEIENAKQAYRSYIALMRDAGRESRIPEFVLSRVEE